MSEERYARHSLIPNWKQERLAAARVAVVGCGALGNEVLKNLALLGVGHIWVIDYDTIEIHNLTRSVLFRESDIGKYKAEVVTQRLKDLNSDIHIHPVVGKLETDFGRGLLREMDVVVGCLDSVRARRLLNKRCYSVGVPWVDGGINHYSGNVALFDPREPETACYRCKMDTSAWERLNESYSCGLLRDDYREPKLATTIMTASVVAAYQAEVVIQLLLGSSNLQPGTQLILPVSQPLGFRTVEFFVDKECPDHYSIPKNKDENLCQFSLSHSPGYVAEKLSLRDGWRLELPFDFISSVTCEKCGSTELIVNLRDQVTQSKSFCIKCGNRREMHHYCYVESNHKDAQKPFSFFKLCAHEIVRFIHKNIHDDEEIYQIYLTNLENETIHELA
ncbi:ThiF family adenylyltransferase [Limnothrix sp. FACHB-708]|uniref:HesA/MoeB/ThiF family protein n=1 Tax=unclassified Limnothrix TaxID=2632864 RepID=UPI001682730D|nr:MULTISPECIES: ThiF family adenylyltransferase [unclassified Limnothrix]MBD2552008.1 ThiF family adenylyltransferase [Limnothrix sp. FACHB-708]MBD2589688.1 ThiF family adenylyltransferase [Limnothrix sp. FACHB-406]